MRTIIRCFCIILYSCMWILASCKNKSQRISYDQINSILQNSIIEFQKSGDTTVLNKCYGQLTSHRSFVDNDINDVNKQSIITLLTTLKKYEKLDKILKNKNNKFEENIREELINMNDYLRYFERDYPKSATALKKNIAKYKANLKINPEDSISELQYYVYDAILNGKDGVLEKIDSIIEYHPKHSYDFYEEIKETINATLLLIPSIHSIGNSITPSITTPSNVEKDEEMNFPTP